MQALSTFEARSGLGDAIEGPALVCPVPFSARYDLDRQTGIFSRLDHPLRGESIAGKILISPGVQGGVAGGWAFLAMQGRGVDVKGLIFGRVNPVVVQGAVVAGIPIIAGVDDEIFTAITSGDIIRMEPAEHRVVLLKSNCVIRE